MELDKEQQGLGLSLAGNRDRSCLSIFVVGLHPGGPAARDGRIRVGDELLEVRHFLLHHDSWLFFTGGTSHLVLISCGFSCLNVSLVVFRGGATVSSLLP